MADQVAAWLTPAAVVAMLPGAKLDEAGQLPADVELLRQAAAAYVEPKRRDLVDAAGVFTPTADVLIGSALLVSRLNARKGSPQGLASFGEFGPAPVSRVDPDVDRLLGIGARYGKPVAR
jgi:hypothetical protein